MCNLYKCAGAWFLSIFSKWANNEWLGKPRWSLHHQLLTSRSPQSLVAQSHAARRLGATWLRARHAPGHPRSSSQLGRLNRLGLAAQTRPTPLGPNCARPARSPIHVQSPSCVQNVPALSSLSLGNSSLDCNDLGKPHTACRTTIWGYLVSCLLDF